MDKVFVVVEVTDGPTGQPRKRIRYLLPKENVFLKVPLSKVYTNAIYRKS
jgi:hypothetical protein